MKISYRTAHRLNNKIMLPQVKYKIYKTKDPLFSCTTSSSWGILLVTFSFLKKMKNIENRSMRVEKIKYKNTTWLRLSGKCWYAHCNKKKSDGRMNVSAEKCTSSSLQNVIKLKQYRVSFRHNEWSFKMLCMCHEVYHSWWLFSSQSPSRFSKWRIIMRHSLNHISRDSSWFSPDTGHRSSESWFSGSHLCMLTLLLIWTWKLPHQTFSQFCVLLPLTIQQMHVKS